MPLSEELQRACEALGASAGREPPRAGISGGPGLPGCRPGGPIPGGVPAAVPGPAGPSAGRGELPREAVDRFYRLRNQVEAHPLIVGRDIALSKLKQYFADVAFQLSALLGADYTALARRA